MHGNSQIILQGDFFSSQALKSFKDDKISTLVFVRTKKVGLETSYIVVT